MDTTCNRVLRGAYNTVIKSYLNVDNDKGGYIKLMVDTPIRKNYPVFIWPSNRDRYFNFFLDVSGFNTETNNIEKVIKHMIKNKTEFTLWYGNEYFSESENKIKYNGYSIEKPKTITESVTDLTDNSDTSVPWSEVC